MSVRLRLLVAATVLAGLAGCTTPSAPEHESQAVPGANLAGYRSFGWVKPAGEATVDAPMRLLDVNIRNALRAEMTRRGYREEDSNPELLLDYETTTEDRLRSSPVRFGIGVGSFGGNVGGSVSMGTPSVQSYQEGRLVVHVSDAAKNQEVWYGTVRGRVDRQSLDAAAVARVVALAMEDFPARAESP